jgi:chromate reductase
MSKPRIIAFAGSTRTDSLNQKLIKVAADQARQAGAEVNLIALRDYPMPLYDGDLESESGLPEQAVELKKAMAEADAFLIASPEYNSSLSAVLKNSIDWTSRPGAVEGSVYAGKTAALISASPGALGGVRGLNHLRSVLMNLGVLVVTPQQAVSRAHQAFNDQGGLKEEANLERLRGVVEELVRVAGRLSLRS